MTFRQTVNAMLRRWYVTLAIVGCAVGFTALLVRDGGLYSTRTVVYFVYLQPNRVTIGPQNGTENEGLIAFAGAVAAEINNGRPVFRYAWEDAPLYGAGMREGVLVGLADVGGQWMTSFTRAEIEIQVVGRSYESVKAEQEALLAKVFETSRSMQGPAYEDATRRVRAEVSPMTSAIDHVAATRLEVAAAYLCTAIAALIAAAWAALWIDRRVGIGTGGRRDSRARVGRREKR